MVSSNRIPSLDLLPLSRNSAVKTNSRKMCECQGSSWCENGDTSFSISVLLCFIPSNKKVCFFSLCQCTRMHAHTYTDGVCMPACLPKHWISSCTENHSLGYSYKELSKYLIKRHSCFCNNRFVYKTGAWMACPLKSIQMIYTAVVFTDPAKLYKEYLQSTQVLS